MDTVRLLLFGTAIGATLANAFGAWRAPKLSVRWSGAIFFVCVAAYAAKISTVDGEYHPLPEGWVLALDIPLTALSVATVGWFWLFMQTLFEDRRVQLWHTAVIVGLAMVGAAATYTRDDLSRWIWLVSNIAQAALLLHTLLIVLRGWKTDLVETRRQLRGPFLAVVTVYTLVMRGLETWATFNGSPEWFRLFNATTLALMCLLGTVIFLDPRLDLFGAASRENQKPKNEPATPDRATEADLHRLDRLMSADQVWREEGLTIASLAVKLNMPEAHLRRLINNQLGYRNFPSFVNSHRIREAKKRLSDPGEARTPVSSIAYDIGFASLGPFNRAFREETARSPSEWRREALGQSAQPTAV